MPHNFPKISYLAVRLAVWFILLSSLPLLALVFFVRQNAQTAFVNLENRHAHELARALAGQMAVLDDSGEVQRLLAALAENGRNVFVLSDDGLYLTHVQAGKINQPAAADFSPAAVQAILTERDGLYSESSTASSFAFAPVPGRGAVVVIPTSGSVISEVILQLEQDSYLQILSAMLIMFVGSGVVIWLLIGLPVRKLTDAAEQLSAGHLQVRVDSSDMIDDLAVLGDSFNTMVSRIRELVGDLEQRVNQRTAQLTDANEKLERQNKRFQRTNQTLAHEIAERKQAERRVKNQLEYARALSACSQTLLLASGSQADNRRLLVEALQHLIGPARVSKIFLYENFDDPDQGFCSRFVVDACAPGIPTALADPVSAVIPWSSVPDENRRRLAAGEPLGGPVKRLFADTPTFRDHLLHTVHVLSVQFFPIHFGGCWWGYIGFDDRLTEREWREEEILLLGTAAEILSSTLQRWQAEENLRLINDRLEQQVKIRTTELSDTVTILQQEIKERERAEAEIQRMLASLEQRVAARTAELATFFDLTVLAGRAANLIDVWQPAMVRILEATRSRVICLHLLTDDQTGLHLAAQQNLPAQAVPLLQTVSLPPDFQRWLQQPNDPLMTIGLPEMTLLPSVFWLPDFQTYLGAQIRVGQQVLGLLSCYRLTNRGFGLDEISLVAALAEQMGMVLETHRLRQTTEEMAVLEERQRLARDLHDSVTQSLYSLTLFARSGREAAEDRDWVRLTASLADIESSATQALKEMRLLLYELRAISLDHEGLAQALDVRLNTVERRTGLRVDYDIDPATLVLPRAAEREMYHVVIEALNNIVKHANARAVSVSLRLVGHQLQLKINDDGDGFEVDQNGRGLGLTGMVERIERLGGRMDITSRPGQGTKISIEVDIDNE